MTTLQHISRKTRDHTRPTTSVIATSRTNRPFLFPKLRFKLKDGRFESVVNIQENVLWNMRALPQKAFQQWSRKLGVHPHTYMDALFHCIHICVYCECLCKFYYPVGISVPVSCIVYMEGVMTGISFESDSMNMLFVSHVKRYTFSSCVYVRGKQSI